MTSPVDALTALVEQIEWPEMFGTDRVRQCVFCGRFPRDGHNDICLVRELKTRITALREQWAQLQQENEDLRGIAVGLKEAAEGKIVPLAPADSLLPQRKGWADDKPDPSALAVEAMNECRYQDACHHWAVKLAAVYAELRAVEAERDTLRQEQIDWLQHKEAILKLGRFLVALPGWPNPTADLNLARDAGRLLQGLEPAQSTGLDEQFRLWHGPVLPALRRAEAVEALVADLQQQIHALSAWRDMASAPKDETWMLVTHKVGQLDSIEMARWNVDAWRTEGEGRVRPTGWLPLPALPSTPQEK